MKRAAVFSIAALVVLLQAAPARSFFQVNYVGSLPAGKPVAVAVDDEGTVYASQEDRTVLVISPQGGVVRVLGKETDGRGKRQLEEPRRVSVSGGKIFVADALLNRIQVFAVDGSFIESVGKTDVEGSFDGPQGIAVRSGVMYVADTGNDAVQIIGPNGVFMDRIKDVPAGDRVRRPTDIALFPNGNILVVDAKSDCVRILTQRGQQVHKLGGFGTPVGIAMDVDGFYVADADRRKILRYDLNGVEISAFGSRGKGEAQFLSITGVAVDRFGKVYVSDLDKGTVSVFLPEQRMRQTAQIKHANAVRWVGEVPDIAAHKVIAGRDGKIYTVNTAQDAIQVISDGAPVRSIKVSGCKPISVAQDGEGRLWVLDGKKERVVLIDAEGGIVRQFGGGGGKEGYFDDVRDIAITSKGIIYVADYDNDRVQAFSPGGLFLNAMGMEKGGVVFRSPAAIAVDPQDGLYVLDDSDRSVTMFGPDGTRVGRFGGKEVFDEPVAIAASRSEIFVLDRGYGEVKVFNHEGTYLRRFSGRGAGRGELEGPSSIALRDEVEILVADTGNKRIQTFGMIYTPRPPRAVTAKGGMHAVTITWSPSPDVYAGEYRVYRSDGRSFRSIGAVSQTHFEDTGLEADTKYEYTVSAVAKGGNEGEWGETVAAATTKYTPGTPKGLATRSGDWNVDLVWDANPESFVREYLVYRDINGIATHVGSTVTPNFTEDTLERDTAYLYYVTAVSTDGIESDRAVIKAVTKAATRPPVEIEIEKISDVFSNSYKIYENEGIGVIRVVNNTPEVISHLKLSFTMQNFMDFPSETALENVPPGRSLAIGIKAVFNNRILQVTEDTPVQTEIQATYYRGQKPITITRSHTINVYDKHRMMWDTRERFAAFITPKDPAIMEFVRSIVTQYGEADNPLMIAGVLFDSLGALSMKYIADPSNPYQIISWKTDTVDYIQYPRETLARNSGDCDDLVGLFAAALESIGVRTVVLDVPGHMFMMFASSIPDLPGIDTMDGMLVAFDGQLWVPLEMTMVGKQFMNAWEAGSKQYLSWAGRGLGQMDIRRSWERFKPASMPPADQAPRTIARGLIDQQYGSEFKTLRKIWIKYKGYRFVEVLRRNPGDVTSLGRLGSLYAQEGEFDEALVLFTKVLELEPQNAMALNNRGNVRYLLDRFAAAAADYEAAAAIDAQDANILVNLARAHLKSGAKDKAVQAFSNAIAVDPTVKGRNRGIAIELSGAW